MHAITGGSSRKLTEYASPVKASKPALGDGGSTTTTTKSQTAPRHLLADGDGRRASSERFNVDALTGGVAFNIPIQTSPGRSGFGLPLQLVYESGSGASNRIFGLGWDLEGVDSITRKVSTSISLYYDESRFVYSAVGEVVPVLKADGNSDETV
ncbi:hypothetical protein J3459_006650 [Metarhizium acridum]|nr:hypothetical protein J3459_006650 [Metarhizium acridum]